MHAAISSHAMAVSWFLQTGTRMIFFLSGRVPAHRRARRRPVRRATRQPRGGPARISWTRSWFESPGAHHSPWKCKKGHHRSGDGPWSKTRKLVGFWLHHPAVVGRLMPTLIRTRVVAARNMFFGLSRGAKPDASRGQDPLFSSSRKNLITR